MYKLTYSPASPYVRKVRLAGYLSGLNDQIELLNPDHETHIKMKSNNPLGKIPVLMTQNGQYIFDSRVIVELLNDTSSKLYPNDDNKKIILTNAALTEGLVDASLLYVYSIRYAGDQKPSEVWQKLQLTKIENTIDYLDTNLQDLEIKMGKPTFQFSSASKPGKFASPTAGGDLYKDSPDRHVFTVDAADAGNYADLSIQNKLKAAGTQGGLEVGGGFGRPSVGFATESGVENAKFAYSRRRDDGSYELETFGSARDAETGLSRAMNKTCLLYTSPSPRDLSTSRMPSSA